ncbi:hypothetical protein ACIBJD_36900 [Kitasatospora sp. NPDC050467]|uniref:hypothetical protein n=1 Tax=Kitasatospora sp. NPDC050467 TaxID=3364053 RepID=UPI0037B62036
MAGQDDLTDTAAAAPAITADADRAGGHSAPFAYEPADRTGMLPPEPDRVPQGSAPRLLRGLGTLTARQSRLRMEAAGAGASRAADGAAVTAMPENAEESQEWLVRPTADGELVVQSLLLSTDQDRTGPLVLTTDPDGSVYLGHERSGSGQEDGIPGQLWTFADTSASLGWTLSDGRSATRLRIHAHRGGCLIEQGYGERLGVGGCDDPRSWWTAEGLTG